MKIKYRPLPYQNLAHQSTKPKVYLSSGYGGGKTFWLVQHCLKLAHLNPGLPGGLLCPTLKMYKRDVLPTMLDIFRANRVPYKYSKSDTAWYLPAARASIFIYHSEDDGLSIRGANLAWGGINEVTLVSKPAFLAFLARLRDVRARFIQLAMSGTPEQFNWCYEYFIENPREDTDLVFGDMRQNNHLHPSYVQSLISSYDPLMVQAYVEGRFVNLRGRRAAWAFDRHKHVRRDVERVPGAPIWVSLDFNVTPMSATLWNYFPEAAIEGRPRLGAFDQVRLDNSNTDEFARHLKTMVNLKRDNVWLYPDPTGTSRKTSALSGSDIDILKDNGFLQIKYKRQVSVKDSLNALNAELSKGNIVISSKCTDLIADLEQCVLREGVFEIDKSGNPLRSHWLDGMKNMIEYEFPINRVTQSRVQKLW